MKWIELLRKDDYALLQSENDTQYCVASGYDPTQPEDEQWCSGTYFTYWYWNDTERKADCLQNALDYFRSKTEKNYLSRCRLEELATLFKDGLISDDRKSAFEFFENCCEITNEEKEWFGIEEDSPIANTKFENPMYNKGYDDGFSDAMNDKEE